MQDTVLAMRRPLPEEAGETAPTNDTHFAVDLAKQLFEEEMAVLHAQATVKTFVGVIAARRVKQRLRELSKAAHHEG
jgi:Protein of unknown function (DUF3562)